MRDELIKKFNELCQSLGIDPMLALLLIVLLNSVYIAKDIKVWKSISSFKRNMDIIIWFALFMILIMFVVKFIRGD